MEKRMAPIKPSISFCLNISLKLQTHSFASFNVLAYHRIKTHCCSLFPCLPAFGESLFLVLCFLKKVHSRIGWFIFLLSPGAFGEKLNKGTMCFDTPCTFQDLVKQRALINLSCSLGLFSLLEKQRSRSKALPRHIPSAALGGLSRGLFPTGKCRPMCSMPKCSGTWKWASPHVGREDKHTEQPRAFLRGIRKEHT